MTLLKRGMGVKRCQRKSFAKHGNTSELMPISWRDSSAAPTCFSTMRSATLRLPTLHAGLYESSKGLERWATVRRAETQWRGADQAHLHQIQSGACFGGYE